MRRVYLTVLIGVAGAGVLSLVLNFFVVRELIARDRAPDRHFLRHGTSELVDRALSADAERVAVDAVELDSAKAAAGALSVSLGAGRGTAWVTAPTEARTVSVYVVTPDGGISRFGPVDAPGPPARPLVVIIAVILIVAMLVSLAVAVPLGRALNGLEHAARRISGGALDARAPPAAGPAREVNLAFNKMADRVQHLLEDQRHLLEAVSHELRTPVARIHFSLEMLADAPDESGRGKRLAAIERDLTELDSLVGELLGYARVVADLDRSERVPLPAVETIEELLAGLREAHPDAELALQAEDDSGPLVEVAADRRAFTRAVRNLVVNAIRYGRGRVEVTYGTRDGRLVVAVADDGPGIAPGDRAHIFEPFTRLDSAAAVPRGVGLGLAIVGRIVEVHGGSISVEDGPLGGARFVSTWPLAS